MDKSSKYNKAYTTFETYTMMDSLDYLLQADNSVAERVYQEWFSLYAHRLYDIEANPNDDDEDEFKAFMELFNVDYEEHPVHYIIDELQNQCQLFDQRRFFRTNVKEELITKAMHPRRMQLQIDHFDDIEDFFNNI